jgi:hypothetical protein
VAVDCEAPLGWAWPQAIDVRTPPPARVLLRTTTLVRAALCVEQDGRPLWRDRRRRLIPNRSLHAPGAWFASVDPAGGPVRWRVS